MIVHVVHPDADCDTKAKIVVNGVLRAHSQTDGVFADEIEIDDMNMSEIIAKLYRVDLDGNGSLGSIRIFDEVQLTIEVVNQSPRQSWEQTWRTAQAQAQE